MEDEKEIETAVFEIQENKTKPENNTPNSVKKGSKTLKSKGKRKKNIKSPVRKNTKTNPASNFQKPRPFPKITLEEALKVPSKIKELNGGNPWDVKDLAKALSVGAKSNNFYYLTAAARDFGLTIGTSRNEKVELAELGKEIVYAPNPEVEQNKKIEAFLNIEVFKKVLDYYKGSSLPDMKYLGNTLEREFGLPPETHEEFSKLFRQNCQELEIGSGEGVFRNNENFNNDYTNAPTTVIIGEQKGASKTKLKAFVIMPFVEKDDIYPKGFFSEVLRSLIIPAGLEAGFTVETANKQGSDVIQSTIINDLLDADLVIADLTAHNPNVLFELGVRMAKDKPVALIKSTGTGRIFDVDNMLRVYEYDRNLWSSTIEKDLPKLRDHIKAAWENREKNMSYMKILTRGTTLEAQNVLTNY